MKKTTGLYVLSITSLMLVYSCGNPHVEMKSKKDRISLPSITEPVILEGLRAPELSTNDESGGVKIATKKPEESKIAKMVNPNVNDDLVISYKVERGDNFKLKLGDCTDLIASTKSCNPEVVFTSSKPGIYKDNLIVSYRSLVKPEESKNVVIPLQGERLTDVIDPASIKPLLMTDDEGKEVIKFSTKKNNAVRKVLVANPNETEDLSVVYTMESGKFFTLDPKDCGSEILHKAGCTPDVIFSANEPGVYKDNIIATYTSKSHPDLTKKVILPVIAEKLKKVSDLNPLVAPTIETKDGKGQVSFSTPDKEHKVPLTVTNIDPDDDLIVAYKIEKGTNFKIDNQNCIESLEVKASCQPVIYFDAVKPGVYQDNLIVTYSSKSNPLDQRKVIVPLNAEKTAIIPSDISLDIIPNLGANGIDFGKSLINQSISQMVVVRNPSDHDLSLISKTVSGSAFEVGKDGSCKKVIAAHTKCTIEVAFNSSEEGLKSQALTLVYSSIYGGTEKKVSAKLLGEKVKDLGDCSGKPCGEPQKPGKIEFSSLNGKGLDFGITGIDSKIKQSIPLYNTGDLSVDISSIELTGAGYSMAHDCAKVLLPGNCNIEITFAPTNDQAYEGLITATTKDGQVLKLPIKGAGKKLANCSKKTVHHIAAQPTFDLKKVTLPYLNSVGSTKAKIVDLYGTKVNSHVKSINRYTVKDAQVVTTFLIPALTGRIETVEFSLDTSKVVLDAHGDTESVCLSSTTIKKCSGKDFDTSYLMLKNPKFWATNPNPVNALYEATLSNGIYKCGAYSCANLKKTFSANKLFELSPNELDSVLKDKVVHLIVTDDTRNMTLPSLEITTSEEIECKK